MKFILDGNRQTVLQMVAQAPDGHTVEIKAPSRSDEQNRLYWAELGKLADKHGHTPSLWHEYFKKQFLGEHTVQVHDEVIWVSASTTKLTKAEFAEYVEQVFHWIAENVPE
jgi:hypothetical protein